MQSDSLISISYVDVLGSRATSRRFSTVAGDALGAGIADGAGPGPLPAPSPSTRPATKSMSRVTSVELGTADKGAAVRPRVVSKASLKDVPLGPDELAEWTLPGGKESIYSTDKLIDKSTAVPAPKKCGLEPATHAAAYLGLSYCTLFTAWGSIQNMMTTLFPSTGFLSLALVYGVFGFSSLFAPTVGQVLFKGDVRLAIFSGSLLYISAMIGAATGILPFLLAASAGVGFGAAMVWVHQGIYVASIARRAAASFPLRTADCDGRLKDTEKEKAGDADVEEAEDVARRAIGKVAGIFWLICSVSGILGNSVGLAVLASGQSPATMIWVFVGIGCFAAGMLFFADPSYRAETTSAPSASSVIADLKYLARFLFSRTSFTFLPLFMMQGISQVLNFGVLPSLVSVEAGPKGVAAYLVILSFSATLTTPLSSRLFTIKGGWIYCMFLVGLSLATEMLLARFLAPESPHLMPSRFGGFAILAVSAGVFDSALNTLLSCTLIHLSAKTPSTILFASAKMGQCLLGYVPMSLMAAITRPHSDAFGPWLGWVEIGVGAWFVVFCLGLVRTMRKVEEKNVE